MAVPPGELSGTFELTVVRRRLDTVYRIAMTSQNNDTTHPTAVSPEERLRTLIEASPDPIFMKDGSGRWLEVNHAGLELFQLENIDYRGKTDHELAELSPFYHDALHYCGETDAAAWSRGGLSRNEERIPTPDGVLRTYDVLKITHFFSEGSRKGLLILGRDITERKIAEEERDRLLEKEQLARAVAERAERQSSFLARTSRILAETLDYKDMSARLVHACVPFAGDWCALWTKHDDGRINMASLAPRSAMPKEIFFEPAVTRGLGTVLLTGKPILIESLADASDTDRLAIIGSTNPADLPFVESLGVGSFLAVPLVVHGRLLGALALGRKPESPPLSSSDLAPAENLALHAGLALANAQLYQQAQNAIVARNEFLSIASHELRTPCTSLRLGIEVLLRHLRQESLARLSPALLERMLLTTDRQSKHLSYLIDRLLDVSRFDGGRPDLTIEDTDLAVIANETVNALREEAMRAGSTVSIDVAGPARGMWDRTRIGQVCTNLLTNAIKYGSGKPIGLRVWSSGDAAFLSVEDQGIGIPSDQQQRIFGRFERAVSNRHYGGLGLGLYICRQIVEAHGGTIDLMSSNHDGTKFIVMLPKCPSASTN